MAYRMKFLVLAMSSLWIGCASTQQEVAPVPKVDAICNSFLKVEPDNFTTQFWDGMLKQTRIPLRTLFPMIPQIVHNNELLESLCDAKVQ